MIIIIQKILLDDRCLFQIFGIIFSATLIISSVLILLCIKNRIKSEKNESIEKKNFFDNSNKKVVFLKKKMNIIINGINKVSSYHLCQYLSEAKNIISFNFSENYNFEPMISIAGISSIIK